MILIIFAKKFELFLKKNLCKKCVCEIDWQYDMSNCLLNLAIDKCFRNCSCTPFFAANIRPLGSPFCTGVNFTNVLHAAFTLVGPKSANWHCWLDYLFLRIRDLRVKAVRRMLMKLSPGVNFINILCASFSYKSFFWQNPFSKAKT